MEYDFDLETKGGLGSCNCNDAVMNKNVDCKHATDVRKFVATKIAQAVMIQNKTQNDSKKHRSEMFQEPASKTNQTHSGTSGNENWPSDDSPEVPS